jgi:predicted secreted protein
MLLRRICDGLAMVALGTMLAAMPAQAQAQAVPLNVLSLSATASVEVTRDVLNISFSAMREGPEAGAVQTQLMQALELALAEARKIARPGQVEVSTGNFSLYPRYAPKGGISGWQGTAEMLVEGRDTEAIARLAGRSQSMSVARVGYSLSREAREKVEAEVSVQAIARFRARAEAYARQFGFASISIREVQVTTNDAPNFPVPTLRAARAGMAASEEALPVEAGKASVSASVNGSVQMK